jgi:hypothetical protein
MISQLRWTLVQTDEYGDSYDLNIIIKVPAGWNRARVNNWARNRYNTWCQHSYDCCGHFYGGVYTQCTKHLKRREWFIKVHQSRNI